MIRELLKQYRNFKHFLEKRKEKRRIKRILKLLKKYPDETDYIVATIINLRRIPDEDEIELPPYPHYRVRLNEN